MSAANQQDNAPIITSTTGAVQRIGVAAGSTSIYYPNTGNGGIVPTYTKTIDVTPNDGDQKPWGGKSTFLIEHNITAYLSGLRLRYKINPAATGGSGAGTYERFNDFIGFFAIKNIQFFFGSNLIQEITGQDMLFQHFTVYKKEEEQEWRAKQVAGNLTEPERDNRFTEVQEMKLDLPFWFTLAKSQAIPEVMSQEMKVIIQWEDYQNVVQTDYANPPIPQNPSAIVDQRLELLTTTVASAEMEANAMQAQQPNGIQYSIRDIQRLDYTFDTDGSTNQVVSFDLRAFNICTQSLIFFIRLNSDVTTPYDNDLSQLVGNGNTFEDTLDLSLITVTGSSRNLKEPVTREHIQSVYWVTHHPSPPGQKVFEISFSASPQSASQSAGVEMDFSNVNNPQLQLTVSDTQAQKYRIDIYNIDRNMIQFKNGGMRKVFI